MTDQKQNNLPIRDYGDFDPLKDTVNHINPCVCGQHLTREHVSHGQPLPVQMGLSADSEIRVKRFFVRCPCGNLGPATKQTMYAVLQWNLSTLCVKPHYSTLPVFNLFGVPREEAVLKLQSIRADLKARLADCEERLKLADTSKHPGPRYHAKLSAYRSWNYYALHLASDNDFFRNNVNTVQAKSADATAA